MFLVSSFILISILLNIDEFMTILGEKFGQVKYVILILGIARLYEIINSSNGTIIILSKYYRYDMVFQVILLALTVITNIILIPLYGINGAALATGITIVLSSSIKGLFVYSKYQLHPYSKGTLKILLVILVCIASTLFIPEIMNVYVTMVIKTSIISVIYLVALFALEISDDLKQLIKSYL
ncbi:polysaccharide biosynthesis C-terminal domain-containing protein [Prolixibacteraceae bacterium Z1-6]|uniref:Polysaccharide biosynthesis C-terminal domain-containing protein n=1 Tax=Draconibacterium aestuarii TaxID=2998507 RepID=A0A9X3J6K3_9BACT|nr:polysaccharide biosynthesis C-terminal domain-containing protein [Prolixibacteraceae bacterium Z1-6]